MNTFKKLMLVLLALGIATPLAMPANKHGRDASDDEQSNKRPKQDDQKEVEEKLPFCTICQENINEGEDSLKLPPCNHIFHHPCIIHTLAFKEECPNCRAEADLSDPTLKRTVEAKRAQLAASERLARRQAAAERLAEDGEVARRLADMEEEDGIAQVSDNRPRADDRPRECPLFDAIRNNDTDMVRSHLNAHPADINALSARGGFIPLTLATLHNRILIVMILLDAGADTNATASDGQTALSIATRLGNTVVRDLLNGHAARVNAAPAVRRGGICRSCAIS